MVYNVYILEEVSFYICVIEIFVVHVVSLCWHLTFNFFVVIRDFQRNDSDIFLFLIMLSVCSTSSAKTRFSRLKKLYECKAYLKLVTVNDTYMYHANWNFRDKSLIKNTHTKANKT